MSIAGPASRKAATAIAAVTAAGLGAYSIKTYLGRRAYAETDKPPIVFNGRPGLISLPLHSVKTVNHNTKRLVFELPDKEARSGLSLTSSLLTISRPNGSWLPVIRPYTPINDLNKPGFIELMVKKYPNGKSSTHLHTLQPGQRLSFLASLPGYPWTPNTHSHIYLLAGGAGITPIYQLIQGILQNPGDKTRMTLVFGANADDDLVLREELDRFKTQFPGQFDVVYTVSSPAENGKESKYRRGRITEELLKEIMTEPKEENVKVFVCGPPAMEKALMGGGGWFGGEIGILGRLGYTKEQIYRF